MECKSAGDTKADVACGTARGCNPPPLKCGDDQPCQPLPSAPNGHTTALCPPEIAPQPLFQQPTFAFPTTQETPHQPPPPQAHPQDFTPFTSVLDLKGAYSQVCRLWTTEQNRQRVPLRQQHPGTVPEGASMIHAMKMNMHSAHTVLARCIPLVVL